MRRALALLLCLPMVAAVWPRERVIVPEWTLTVMRDGKPVPGALVRQVWRDYSTITGAGEDARFADQHGRVTFPRRVVRASVLHRAVICTGQYLGAGIHGSCGPGAFVAAYQDRFEGWADYERGRALPPVIELDHER